jgi:hypothetical protein
VVVVPIICIPWENDSTETGPESLFQIQIQLGLLQVVSSLYNRSTRGDF